MSLLPTAVALLLVAAILAPRISAAFPKVAAAALSVFVAALDAVLMLVPDSAQYTISWIPEIGVMFRLGMDGLSRVFVILVLGIGALVLLFAGGYLRGDPRLGRLLGLLLAFMASMVGLVLSQDAITLFLFWEGTSLTSYLLIGFDHHREKSRKNALQAMIVTGGGGLALLAGLILAGLEVGSFSIPEMVRQGDLLRASPLYPLIFGLVALGCFAKSAQFPFHFWLPNAMDAPTPVSAYLHSATMVKAGVFLLARLNPALGGTELWTNTLVVVGASTAVVGTVLSLLKTDLKQILAYSTVAALGMLTLSIGLGDETAWKGFAGFLVAHALYKGALFMVAGAVDHATHTRDIRELGGLGKAMPWLRPSARFAAYSMAGVPIWLGFVGKEYLLEAMAKRPALLVVGAIFALGSVTAAWLVGLRPFQNGQLTHPEAHDPEGGMLFGPHLLAGLSLLLSFFLGSLSSGLFAPLIQATAPSLQPEPLKLWHGLTPALAISIAALVLGTLLASVHSKLLDRTAQLGRLPGPERLFQYALQGLMTVAKAQTGFIQHGKLRLYIATFFGTMVGLVCLALFLKPSSGALQVQAPLVHEVVIVAVSVASALAAALSSSRLAAVAMLGITGFSIATLYMLFGAPDLSITQLLVEALTVVLFVLAFYHLPRFSRFSGLPSKVRDAIIASASGLVVAFMVLQVSSTPAPDVISKFFLERSVPEAYGRNVVNTIIVDFRALDTLGEITVLALAALGVYGLLKLRRRQEDGS